MNVLFLGQGTRGDLYPLLGMARSLAGWGHRVAVLEYDEYAADVRDAGLEFVQVGVGSQCAEVFEAVPAGPATRRTEWITERLYAEASLGSARAFVEVLAAFDGPVDAIVAPSHHLGATFGAELLEVPLVSTFLGTSALDAFDTRTPSGLSSSAHERSARLIDRFARPRIAALREEMDLPPPPDDVPFARVDRAGGLVLTAAPLAGVSPWAPPTFELAGYPDYYGPGSLRLDPATLDFLAGTGPPVVVCTLGDGWARSLPDQLRQLVARADSGRYRLLVVAGRIPGLSSGPGTRVVPRVNLAEVMRYADVSVNHGGMGTLVAGLRNAVPSVMMTQWPDGRRNAAALASLDLGVDLGSDPRAEDLVTAIDRVVRDDGMRERLSAASTAMRRERDPAAVLLDRVARTKRGDRAAEGAGRGGPSR